MNSSCGQSQKPPDTISPAHGQLIITSGSTIKTRFKPPDGFEQVLLDSNSFGSYLSSLPLKPQNSQVTLYNGKIKPNRNIYVAVVDLPIGTKDLHQCADAVIRLRAEYLYKTNQFDKIHFNFTNGFNVEYTMWMKGNRIAIKNNKTWWEKKEAFSNSYDTFWKYLETVFMYAGTKSLEQELEPISIEQIQIGDVFIQGGFPGHAIIIVDMAVNPSTGEKVVLLAQSYMPAQELQILVNRNDKEISPWYSVHEMDPLVTPEWIFRKNDLRRFK